MKLTRLRIARLPGIDAPFELGPRELARALHVVHGPNESGKSSLVRALRAVLWPELLRGEQIEVEARFVAGATEWFVRRDGSRVAWQRDGAPSQPPDLPPAELASSFLVTIEDVTRLDGDDFAARIRSALAGGVDFEELAKRWKWSPQAAAAPESRLRNARNRLREAEEELAKLDEQARESSSLEGELAHCKALQADARVVDELLELLDLEEELLRVRARLEAYPDGMELLQGNEAARRSKLEGELQAAQGDLRSAADEVQALSKHIAAFGLDTPIPESELATLDERIQVWAEREKELDSARRELEQAEARFGDAARRCPPGSKPEALLALEPPQAAKLDRLVRDAGRVEAERIALRSELDRLPRSKAGPTLERLMQATVALRAWLREPEHQDRAGTGPTWVIVAAASLGFVLAGVLSSPYYFAGAVVVIVLGLFHARGVRAAPSSRPTFERQFANSGLPVPEWTPAAVQQRLSELESQSAEVRVLESADVRRGELERKLADLVEELRSFESIRDEVRAALGVDALATDFELHGFAAAVTALRSAHGDVRSAAAAVQRQENERTKAMEAASSALVRWRASRVERIPEARGASRELRTRSSKLAESLQARDRARTDEQRAQEDVDGALAELRRFWKGIVLEHGADAELNTRLGRLPEWKQLKAKEQQDRLAKTRLEQRLGERAQELRQGRGILEQQKREAGAAADRTEKLIGELKTVEERLRSAREALHRESAAAEVASCRAALGEQLSTAHRQRIGGMLLEEVKAEYEQRSQPAVLQRASRNLERFTHGRRGVRGERSGGVRVLDHASGRGLALDELSTGTRAQLLLALRQAFAAEAAHGERVPFVLDDALATSDPDRIRAVGDALRAITREDGWQVLYLTTDAADVGMLVGDDREGVDVVDLAELRVLERGTLARDRLVEPASTPAPEPGDMSAEAYGELLGVQAIDAFAPASALHPFYVLRDDRHALKRVLDARIASVGGLETLLERRPDLLDSEARTRFRAWSVVARATFAAWRVGRGAPVDRGVLAHPDSGVTEQFLDKLTEITRDVRGDARELLKRIDDKDTRASRFRATSRQTLEQFLEAGGHYDPRTVLDREEAWMRVLTSDFGEWRPATADLRARFEWLWSLLEDCVSSRGV
ncbi:MAG: AAA family ATPase [Planctomycetes bacterium]|nr:AAA family ATPase [Planctomycetota bacterium]